VTVAVRQLAAPHSITSSARASSIGGTSRPRAFAVVRLMTMSNLVGCSTTTSKGACQVDHLDHAPPSVHHPQPRDRESARRCWVFMSLKGARRVDHVVYAPPSKGARKPERVRGAVTRNLHRAVTCNDHNRVRSKPVLAAQARHWPQVSSKADFAASSVSACRWCANQSAGRRTP
jgi:hypothetical protein